MIFDKEVLLADNLAFDAQDEFIYLGPPVTNFVGPGAGKPIAIHLSGSGLTTAGSPGIEIVGSVDGLADAGLDMVIYFGLQAVHDKGVTFWLPSNVSRWIRAQLINVTAGVWHCGIIINE